MAEELHDVVVIGPGIGGLAAARAIAHFGGERALIPQRYYLPGGMTHRLALAAA